MKPNHFSTVLPMIFLLSLLGCNSSKDEKKNPPASGQKPPSSGSGDQKDANKGSPTKPAVDCSQLNMEGKWKQIIYSFDGSGKVASTGEPEYKMIKTNTYTLMVDGKPNDTMTLLTDSCVLETVASDNNKIRLKITELNLDKTDSSKTTLKVQYCHLGDCSNLGAKHDWTKIK